MSTKPSFENHIRHMFRDIDVENMSFMFDFTSYEDVKTNSQGHPYVSEGRRWTESDAAGVDGRAVAGRVDFSFRAVDQ